MPESSIPSSYSSSERMCPISFCNRAIYYMDRVAYGKWRDVVVSVNFAGQKAKPETRRALLRKWRPGHLAHDKVVDLQYFDEVEGVADAPREEGGESCARTQL